MQFLFSVIVLKQFSKDVTDGESSSNEPPEKRLKFKKSLVGSKEVSYDWYSFYNAFDFKEGEGFRILDALSASGLRALRFAKEVPNVASVLANDFSKDAFKAISENIRLNNVEHIVQPSYSNAMFVFARNYNCCLKLLRLKIPISCPFQRRYDVTQIFRKTFPCS